MSNFLFFDRLKALILRFFEMVIYSVPRILSKEFLSGNRPPGENMP